MHPDHVASQASLLAPDEPPACQVYNPQGGARALLVCDHASNRIPRSLGDLGLAPWHLRQHIAVDIGAERIARELADSLDAPLVLAGYSRLVIDLNRGLSDPSSIPEVSDGVTIPGNLALSAEARRQRVHELFLPYRQAIDGELHRFRARDVVPAFIAIHSFTPTLQNQQRPWQLGILWDKDPRIPVPLLRKLRAHPRKLVVGDNEPYSGRHPADYTIDHHAEASGLPHVSIEIRQDLVADDARARKWATILHDCLREILAEDSLYALWQGH